MVKRRSVENKAQIVLGEHIERLRKDHDLTRMQLGKMVRVTEQQIAKYEAGAFVPLPMLEKLGDALDMRVQKKLIRKISSWRNYEREQEDEAEDAEEALIALYNEAFLDD